MPRFYPTLPRTALNNTILVFGTDLAGQHTRTAAGRLAVAAYGASIGKAKGLQRHAYAIAVSDANRLRLPMDAIADQIGQLLLLARSHEALQFVIADLGTGRSGWYAAQEVAPHFAKAPRNCLLPQEWRPTLRWIVDHRPAVTPAGQNSGSFWPAQAPRSQTAEALRAR